MAVKHPSRRRHNGNQENGPIGPIGPIDPTENVKALSEALSDRQDDLRELNNKYLDARLGALDKSICSLVSALKEQDSVGLTHQKELRGAEEKLSTLRAEHSKEMRESESKRIDAIRATDVAAVSTTAAQSLAAIQTLASTATATAETLRNQVISTATTIANQTDRIVSPIMERLAALEKTSNIVQGRSTVADPQVAELMTEMRRFSSMSERGTGKSEGISSTWAVLVSAAMLLVALLTIGAFMFSQHITTPVTPQIYYVPAPAGTQLPALPPAQVPR